MRISDWSSDVCSSDLVADRRASQCGTAARRGRVQGIGKVPGASQSQDAGAGGAPVSGAQAAVWLHQGALSRLGEEPRADVPAFRLVEPVDGAHTVTGCES